MGFLGFSAARCGLVVAAVLPLATGCGDRDAGDPAPTESSLTAPLGPEKYRTEVVPRAYVEAFGGGTIYYPAGRPPGERLGAVTIVPGSRGYQSGMAWYGPLLASRGFIVFTIDTLHLKDQPAKRSLELEAALTYLATRSAVASHVDAERLAVMGHSLGGGGTLDLAATRPNLKAAIPLMPYDKAKDFSNVRVPTLVVAAQHDKIAPVGKHAEVFYRSIPASQPKAYLEIAGATHSFPKRRDATLAKYVIAWLKRYVDGDKRYDRFLCPGPQNDPHVARYASDCTPR